MYNGKEVDPKIEIKLARDQYFQVINNDVKPVENVAVMVVMGQRPCYIAEYKNSAATMPISVNPILMSNCLSKRKMITISVESKILFNIPVIE